MNKLIHILLFCSFSNALLSSQKVTFHLINKTNKYGIAAIGPIWRTINCEKTQSISRMPIHADYPLTKYPVLHTIDFSRENQDSFDYSQVTKCTIFMENKKKYPFKFQNGATYIIRNHPKKFNSQLLVRKLTKARILR